MRVEQTEHRRPLRHRIFAEEPDWQCSLMLVLQVVFLFIAVPALGPRGVGENLIILLQLFIAGVVITLIARSTWLRVVLALSFGFTLLAQLLPGLVPRVTTLSVVFVYNLLVTIAMARAVFGPGGVTHHRIAGAVFIYLNVALLFSLAYAGITIVDHDALKIPLEGGRPHFVDLIHLSFATLTTIGDSQASWQSPLARSLADLETIIGQLFPAVLLSRLVGLHLHRASR